MNTNAKKPAILAVIPARAGSKGLPDKNIRPLCGLPLCAHTINAAVESGIFEEIHFSTDSQQYADIALAYGARVPFLRNPELAGDTTPTWDVLKDVVNRYRQNGREFDALMLLQVTVPLRSVDDIREATTLFLEKNANAVVSVTDPAHSPQWCAEIPPDGDMRVFHERMRFLRARQSLAKQYILNGAIYLTKISHLMNCSDIYEKGCYAYHMPRERSFDIDDNIDFEICELLMSKIKS